MSAAGGSQPQTALPVDAVLPELLDLLARHSRCVLEAAPGAGKTTRVPPALLAARWCSGRIIMLEPRRIAARAAAEFMARVRGETVGETIGYRIRHEVKVSRATRVEVVTEGILTRMLQDDPTLDGVSAVIFDEFHERHLEGDLALALTLDGAAALRPDLRLIVMSATLDGARLSAFLDAPVINVPGREFPVTVEHLVPQLREPDARFWRRAAERALAGGSGDALWFLPGRRDMERIAQVLAEAGLTTAFLHGDMSVAEQAAVIAGGGQRRVVLATNVAESSVTLAHVDAVIDSGLVRESRYDPVSGMARLETVYVTRPSALQRAGRAGRTAPGRAWRLWPKERVLEADVRAEIGRADLCRLLLELRLWGNDEAPFLDAPPPAALARAEETLVMLGALDASGRPTAHGRAIARLAMHPRLASALVRAPESARTLAAEVAALLAHRDPLPGETDLGEALHRLRGGARGPGWRAVRRDAARWQRQRGRGAEGNDSGRDGQVDGQVENQVNGLVDAHAGAIVAAAFPERVAARDAGDPLRYRLAGGGAARLDSASRLTGHEWLAVADLERGQRDSRIRRAAALDPAALKVLLPDRFAETDTTAFDQVSAAVVRRRERRFGAIVLETRTLAAKPGVDSLALLSSGIRALGAGCLPWDATLRRWQARVCCLREWLPQLKLPDLADAALVRDGIDWLLPWLQDYTRVDQVSRQDLGAALRSRIDWQQQQALDQHAPETLTVPSGRSIRVDYQPGTEPVLAVKLQEMFGQHDTPTVARGRVPVVVHLLSPRGNAVQVTRDLAGFWASGYAEVRRELAGRYPRHPWPEDPLSATATHLSKKQAARRGGG